MEKSGLYSRQGILQRKPKSILDKNHTHQQVEETKHKAKDNLKKEKLGKYHNYLRVNHFGTHEERNLQKQKFKQEADLQLRIREQQKAEEKRKVAVEDKQMLNHLKRQLERDAIAKQQKKETLMKIAQENKQSALFKKNTAQLVEHEDKFHAHKDAQNHDLGFRIRF